MGFMAFEPLPLRFKAAQAIRRTNKKIIIYIIILIQWRRQNFSAAGAQPGHQNLDWGTFKNYAFLISSRSLLLHCKNEW